MKASIATSACLMCLALSIAACGSSSSESTTEALSHSEFIKRADRQCNKGNELQSTELQAFREAPNAPPAGVNTEKEAVLTVILPNVRKNIEQLAKLEAPPGEQEEVQAIVAANLRAIEEAEKDPRKVMAAYTASTDKKSIFAEGTRLSTAYGFKVCGQY